MRLPRSGVIDETIARYTLDDDPLQALSATLCAFALVARAAAAAIERREPYPNRSNDAAAWRLAADRAIAADRALQRMGT
jgi:hypothetical protein